MSTTNNEALYETCHDEAWEEFQSHNKLTDALMYELVQVSPITLDHIDNLAWIKYQDRLK